MKLLNACYYTTSFHAYDIIYKTFGFCLLEIEFMLASLYAVAAVIACIEFLMLFVLIKKPSPKHILILAAVMVSSFGYLALSVSRTLEEALLANKILYVGSYLPLLMLVTTAEFCKF